MTVHCHIHNPVLRPHPSFGKASAKTYQDQIQQLIGGATNGIRRQFMEMVKKVRSTLDLQRLAQQLQMGNLDGAMNMLNGYIDRYANGVVSYMVVGGTTTATFLENALNIHIGFDQVNYRAVQMMQDYKLTLIREFTQDQRDAARVAMTQGIISGSNPIDQARAFRDSVGLTARQEAAVQNYGRLLANGSAQALQRELRDRRFDPTVLNAINEDGLLSADQITRMIERYRERYIAYRAETIARTEALRAIHESSNEMFQQAVDSGNLQADELVQEWLTAEDERVRDSHATMDGQQVTFGEPFISGNGVALQYPGDPDGPANETINCRCTVTTRIRGV